MSQLKNRMDSLLNVYNNHKDYLGSKSLPPQKINFDNFAAAFFCPGPFYYYVIDSPTLTMDYVSPSVEDILGITSSEFGFQSFMELVHPDDLNFLLKCENKVADFLKNEIAPESIVNYKINYCLREKTRLHGYRLFLIQTITLQTSSSGALLKVFGLHTDITHLIKENNGKISFVGLLGHPSYLGLEVDNGSRSTSDSTLPVFTSRELQVMKLLGEGFTTNKISEMLFISGETVNSHRKNMLAKTGFQNTTQLLAFCIRAGLI